MAITVISNGEGLKTKGDIDKASLLESQKQQKTEVLFKNRFGREVIITEYHAKKMVRRGEGEIIGEGRPIQKRGKKIKQETIEDLRTQFEEMNGRKVPNNKTNDALWIKEHIGE